MFNAKVIAIVTLLGLLLNSLLPASVATATASLVLAVIFAISLWPVVVEVLNDTFDIVIR